jgi:hypothetical protein
MNIIRSMICNLVVPAVVSAMIVFVGTRIGRSESSGRRWRWGVAVGLGLGYLSGHYGIFGWPTFPGVEAIPTLFCLVLLGMILGVIESSWLLPAWSTWSARGFLTSALIAGLLARNLDSQSSILMAVSSFLALWLVLIVSWWNLEAQATRLSGPGWMVPITLISLGWAIAEWMEGCDRLWPLHGVFASACFGCLTTLGIRPGLALSKGGPVIALTVLAGLAVIDIEEAKLPRSVVTILCLAPWVPWIDRIALIRRRSYWTRASIRFLAVLMTIGLALVLADAKTERMVEGPANH